MRSENNGKSILLVDDEVEVRNYLEMSLRCAGYSAESAGDGEDAIWYAFGTLRRLSRPCCWISSCRGKTG